jgi:diguanylate cyclase (GGDEF)-like protein
MEFETRANAQAGAVESTERDAEARARDRISDNRDDEAKQRDVRADERDLAAFEQDEADGLAGLKRENDREIARGDRLSSADDRLHAAEDREVSAEDRSQAAAYSDSLLIDGRTGFYQHGAGLHELEREAMKARRTDEPFVIAVIDVDQLKETNDAQGYRAGERLLGRVATAIRRVVRDYDVVVRFGGDQFVCGALGLDVTEAKARFDMLNAGLAASGCGTASVGVVRLEEGEALEHAITRADAAMCERKRINAAEANGAESIQPGKDAPQ